MAHFHLCWEIGAGLGHAGRLKILALALLGRGHRVTMSLRDLPHTHAVLADLDIPKLQAPFWMHRTAGMPANQSSLAEILLSVGYLEARELTGMVEGWRSLYRLLQPDLIVADYAPTAILAARSMGLRSASVGLGFYSPPQGMALPCLRDWENIPPQRLQAAEARVLQTANAVLAQAGAAPFALAAELILGDVPLLCTWPELDHYGRPAASATWHGPNFLPQAGLAPKWPPGDGPKVFAYLRMQHAEHADVLAALVRQGCRVLCYLPEVAGGRAPPVTAPNIIYARRPLSLNDVFSEAQLCVNHGGEATLVQALLAGVPVLLAPIQLEQFLMARRVQAMGAGINAAQAGQPADWDRLLRLLLDNPSYAQAARAFAARHQDFNQERMAEELADIFERNVTPAAI
ncbi:MAG: nucleotide disphospho-sugar-binding domain-containing protein [Pseudomonadota bacterium]